MVDQIKADMLAEEFEFETERGRILGRNDKRGRYYISDGHHRVVAALELYKETGDCSYLDRLLELFRRIDPATGEVDVVGERVFDPAEVYGKK